MPPRSRRRFSLSRRRPRRSVTQARRVTRRRRTRRSLSGGGRGIRTTLSGSYAMRGQLPGAAVSATFGRRKRRSASSVNSFRAKVLDAITPLHKYNNTEWGGIAVEQRNAQYFIAGHQLLFDGHRNSMSTMTGGSVIGQDTTRYTIKDMSHITTLANMSVQIVHLRAYLCTFRRDWPNQVLGEVFNANPAFATQTGALYQGFLDNPGVTTDIVNDPAGTLFMNPRITAYCKISKVANYQLAPGENKVFSVRVNKPKYINMEINRDAIYMRGSKFWVFQIWGGVMQQTIPVENPNPPPATVVPGTGGFVSTSRCRVDFITKTHYNFQFITPNRTQVAIDDSIQVPLPNPFHVNSDIATFTQDETM